MKFDGILFTPKNRKNELFRDDEVHEDESAVTHHRKAKVSRQAKRGPSGIRHETLDTPGKKTVGLCIGRYLKHGSPGTAWLSLTGGMMAMFVNCQLACCFFFAQRIP